MPLYRHLNVHGYWLVRDTKMSKTLGNVVDPMNIPEQFGMDVFRYFLLREMHFGSDASFTEEALISRANADLANDLGNLFSRVLSMAAKYHNALVPEPGALHNADEALRDLAAEAVRNFTVLFGDMRPDAALVALWELVRGLNKYVDSQAPWALAKAGQTGRLNTVMYRLLECMEKVACCLWPVMPDASAAMLRQLGREAGRDVPPLLDLPAEPERWGRLRPGQKLAAASNLFPRMEPPKSGTGKRES
jgi:methionyl-tRNA synthetase